MGLVDYISRQPNQKAKVAKKYDKEFAVPAIIRIFEAIAAICINFTSTSCQSLHVTAVNHTYSTRASSTQQINHSNSLSALNARKNWLLLSNTANAAQIQVNSNSNRSA